MFTNTNYGSSGKLLRGMAVSLGLALALTFSPLGTQSASAASLSILGGGGGGGKHYNGTSDGRGGAAVHSSANTLIGYNGESASGGGGGGLGGGSGTGTGNYSASKHGAGASHITTGKLQSFDYVNLGGGSGGNGGSGYDDGWGTTYWGSSGGNGGSVSYTHNGGNLKVEQNVNISGGNVGSGGGTSGGGSGSYGGSGGAGGSASLHVTNGWLDIGGKLTAAGGSSSNGSVLIDVAKNFQVHDAATLTGGAGGVTFNVGGEQARFQSDLFATGKVTIDAEHADVTVKQRLALSSNGSVLTFKAKSLGLSGNNGNNTVTSATGTVNMTVAGNISATENNTTLVFSRSTGTLNASIGGLEAQHTDFTVNFTGTNASDVVIGDLHIYGVRTLAVRNTGSGDATFSGDLNVYAWQDNLSTDFQTAHYSSNIANALDFRDADKNINFLIPMKGLDAGDTVLNMASGSLDINEDTKTTIGLVGQAKDFALNVGDAIILVDDVTDHTNTGYVDNVIAEGFGTYDYLFGLDVQNGDELLATFSGYLLNEGGAHNYLQGYSAGFLTVQRGNDNLVTALQNPMVVSNQLNNSEGLLFFQGSYMDMEYETGSHVDVESFHLTAGPGLRFANDFGSTSVGVFAEMGHGSYDAYNSFNSGSYKGSGDIDYYGAGVLARHDFNNGVYLEAAARGGRVETEYNSKWKAGVDFDDVKSTYYGGHLGGGWQYQVTENGTFDFSLRGLWTHQDGDSVTNDAGEHLKFDDSDSFRTQLGVDYTYKFGEAFSATLGAAWDYEFDGEVNGTIDGQKIRKVETDGSTGIARIGVQYHPNDKITFGVGGFGAVGQREGGGAEVTLSIKF